MRRTHKYDRMTALEAYLRHLIEDRARGRDAAIGRAQLLAAAQEQIGPHVDDRKMRRALERLVAVFRCPIVGDDSGGGYFWATSPDEYRLAIGQIAARLRSLAKKLSAFDMKASRGLTRYAEGIVQGSLFEKDEGRRMKEEGESPEPTAYSLQPTASPDRGGVDALREWNNKHAGVAS